MKQKRLEQLGDRGVHPHYHGWVELIACEINNHLGTLQQPPREMIALTEVGVGSIQPDVTVGEWSNNDLGNFSPAVVVEILSPSDKPAVVAKKLMQKTSVGELVMIDPILRQITVLYPTASEHSASRQRRHRFKLPVFGVAPSERNSSVQAVEYAAAYVAGIATSIPSATIDGWVWESGRLPRQSTNEPGTGPIWRPRRRAQ